MSSVVASSQFSPSVLTALNIWNGHILLKLYKPKMQLNCSKHVLNLFLRSQIMIFRFRAILTVLSVIFHTTTHLWNFLPFLCPLFSLLSLINGYHHFHFTSFTDFSFQKSWPSCLGKSTDLVNVVFLCFTELHFLPISPCGMWTLTMSSSAWLCHKLSHWWLGLQLLIMLVNTF